MKQNSAGLTLIEIMVVMAILAILITLGWMAWPNQINKANDADRKDDLSRLAMAFEESFSDADCYPAADILQNCTGQELSPYLEKIPCDPVTHTPYCYIADTGNPGCFKTFKILAHLDNDSDPVIADLGCDGSQACGYEAECYLQTGETGYHYGVSSTNTSLVSSPGTQYYCMPGGCTLYEPSSHTCSPVYNDANCTGSGSPMCTIISDCH